MNLFDDYSALDNVLIATPEVRERGFSMWRRFGGSTDVLESVGLAGKARAREGPVLRRPARSKSAWRSPRGRACSFSMSRRPAPAPSRRASRASPGSASITIVLIEHDMKLPVRLADHIYVMHWGQVIAQGTPAGCAPALGSSAPISAMLSISDIHAFYGETQVLFGVSIDVAQGEVVALLGPNGAGKTTTLRSILNLAPVRSGPHRLRWKEHYAAANARDRARRHRLGARRPARVPDPYGGEEPRHREEAHAPGAWSERECFEIFTALEYLRWRECETCRVARCRWWRSRAR